MTAPTQNELDRRQRWAVFSVQAHRNLGALASDVLLYERLVLPVPADQPELDRWQEQDWNPDVLALRKVQGGGLIHTVPWTQELRDEHRQIMGLQRLHGEIGYGLTAGLLATSARAWPEIVAGLDPNERPGGRPFLIAAYQSAKEAEAALALRSASAHPAVPGERPEDVALALRVECMLEQPVQRDPEEAFLRALDLAADDDFITARRALFNYVDGLAIDQRRAEEVTRSLARLEADYNEAVRQSGVQTRKHRAVTLLPRALGMAGKAAGEPASATIGGAVSTIAGRFVPAGKDPQNPGKALAMIRAAFRDSGAARASA